MKVSRRSNRNFVGLAVIAICAVGIYSRVDRSPPRVKWIPYSQQTLQQYQGKHETVLVFLGAEVDVNSEFMFTTRMDSHRVRRLLVENGIVTLRGETGRKDADSLAAQEIMTSLDYFNVPLIAIYCNGETSSPVVVKGVTTEEELILAINEALDRR